MSKIIKNPIVVIISFLFLFCNIFSAFAQESKKDTLEKAQWLYHHENYEEAVPLFKKLKEDNPDSSEISYYLGLTYKQLQQYKEARPYFEEAITLQPPVEKAVVELIDLLYQIDQLDAAKKWIGFAEKNFINPGQVAFLKGLILLRQGDDISASLQAFTDAEALDSSLSEAVKYQKAICFTQLNQLKIAKDIFKEIVVKDPAADLAAFSNEYINAISRRQDAAKPFHANVGYSFAYDDNVVFRPNDDVLATSVTEKDDYSHILTAQADYNLKFSDFFGVKLGGTSYLARHNSIGYYDVGSYDFPVQPVFYLEKATIAFPVHYNYVSVNDERYLETSGIGNINNFMVSRNKMVQIQAQFNDKKYHWPAISDDEKKDGNEYLWSFGWYNFFGRDLDSFLNLRYTFNCEDTVGRNWRYNGHRFTLTSVVALSKKVNWNLVFDYFRQNFTRKNSSYDIERKDNVFTVSNLLSYEFLKGTELNLQHTFVYDDATIGAYKYKKNIYSVGTKYRF